MTLSSLHLTTPVAKLRSAAVRLLIVTAASALLLVGLAPTSANAAGASITLSSASGQPGTSVAVSGTGFPKRAKGTVTAGSATVAITTTATGTFRADVVPAGSGAVTVTATAGGVVARSSYTVVAPASPAPTTTPEPAPAPAPTPTSAPSPSPTPTPTTAPTPAPTPSPSPSPTASPTPTTAPAPPTTPVVNAAKGIRFGIGTNGGPAAGAELDEVGSLSGEAPSIVLSYKDFNQPAPIAELDAVRARGAETLLTWEPWTWGGGVNQPAYSLDRITAGDHDARLREWGQALGAWGQPVYLRFGHEMNGDWYPWAEGVNGNGAGDYVAAYQHVHDVVASTGATNIRWVWNPNVPYWGSTPLSGLYPGAGYADVVALDGYNWGTSQSWSTWQEPDVLFGDGIAQLRQLAPGKQIIIAETSSSELGGSKPAWIRNLFSYMSAQSDVVGLVWFHIDKEADWRINSTAASAEAFRAGLAGRR